MSANMQLLMTLMVSSIYGLCFFDEVVLINGPPRLSMSSYIGLKSKSISRVDTLNVHLKYKLTVLFIDAIIFYLYLLLTYYGVANLIPCDVLITKSSFYVHHTNGRCPIPVVLQILW